MKTDIDLSIKRIDGKNLTEESLSKFIKRGLDTKNDVRNNVEKILNEIKINGDKAICEFTEKFDGIKISPNELEVSKEEIDKAFSEISPNLLNALKQAKENIEKFHSAQLKEDWRMNITDGVEAGQIYRPLYRVGLYVPGGKTVYPSSVLMEAIPAKVAGVKELILCSPPQKNGQISPAILAAAKLCGVNRIFKCGGAQAIAGMAYGTNVIPPVDKIVGPGNKWVAAAKQLVNTHCAIDNPAGPSEILLVVDEKTPDEWAIYDLFAQIEHGPDNIAVLTSTNKEKIDQILNKLTNVLNQSPRKDILKQNLNKSTLIIDVENEDEMIRIINLVATEHLHLSIKDPEKLLPKIRNAGAVFLGYTTPVPLGDYCAGTNHVLPTGGYAKFYSGLSTWDFVKIMDILKVSKKGIEKLANILQPIADFEGLSAHKEAVFVRLNENK